MGRTADGPTEDRPPAPLPSWLGWMVRMWPWWLAAMGVALVVGIVHQHPAIGRVCGDSRPCAKFQVDAVTAAALARHGIGLGFYAWAVAGAHLLFASMLLLLGYLTMRRSGRELLPVLGAWVFPALGATFFVAEPVAFQVGWFSPLLFAAFVANRLILL